MVRRTSNATAQLHQARRLEQVPGLELLERRDEIMLGGVGLYVLLFLTILSSTELCVLIMLPISSIFRP